LPALVVVALPSLATVVLATSSAPVTEPAMATLPSADTAIDEAEAVSDAPSVRV
jgi:hypothetical protein